MSKAIETLRQHFNQKQIPSSKVLMQERDRVNAMIDAVEAENEELRELASKNWYIALSERHALRVHDIVPDNDAYIAVLDDAIDIARDRMRELEIEVD